MIILPEAILGLGTNIQDKLQNIKTAIQSISRIPRTEIIKVSKLYETEPFEVPDQQDNYINCCIRIHTYLSAHTLLGACLGIEAGMGRQRKFKFCSRIIDIDLLLYDDLIHCDSDLIVPHPEIKKRAFVMAPLNDLCQDTKFGGFNFETEFNNIDISKVKVISQTL